MTNAMRVRQPAALGTILTERSVKCFSTSTGLADLLKHHTWVGLAAADLACVQHETKLYICKIRLLWYELGQLSALYLINLWLADSKKLIYEETLRRFSTFAPIRFARPVPIGMLLQLALDSPESGWVEEDGPKEDIIQVFCSCSS